MLQIIYDNAASLPTTLRRRSTWHIGLIMSAALYATLVPNAATAVYAAPIDPGPTAIIRNGASALLREDTRA